MDGSVAATCSPASGSTFALGATTVTCSATDAAGNTGTATFRVNVRVSWSNVLQPINVDGTSVFKLGRTVPVKFKLTSSSAPITNLVARIFIARMTDQVVGTEVEPESTSGADDGNTFRSDGGGGNYIFNWGTRGVGTGPGTYQIRIDLGDGSSNIVVVSLRP